MFGLFEAISHHPESVVCSHTLELENTKIETGAGLCMFIEHVVEDLHQLRPRRRSCDHFH